MKFVLNKCDMIHIQFNILIFIFTNIHTSFKLVIHWNNCTVYSVIILDEAHERTLYTDIIVGLMKKVGINVFIKTITLSPPHVENGRPKPCASLKYKLFQSLTTDHEEERRHASHCVFSHSGCRGD